MKKTMNYQIGFKKYEKILCQTQVEIDVIKMSNKMQDAFNKSQITYHKKTISVDSLRTNDCAVEIADIALAPLDKLIYQEKYQPLYTAIRELNDIQRDIFISHVLKEETFRTIGCRLCCHHFQVFREYDRILLILRTKLKNIE